MNLEDLDHPFAPEDIEWRIQQSGKTNAGKIWAMVLCYVTNRAIMKRLDDVCGKAAWRNEYRDIPNNGGVECGISIKIDGEWITKWDAAENTQVESVKGGRSGAMKRAAVQWGIGRYLYNLEEGFAQASAEKIQGWNRAKLKDGTQFYWSPPALPSWALPAQQPVAEKKKDPSPDDILSRFTEAARSMALPELTTAYNWSFKALVSSPDHQSKLTDVFTIRKEELEAA
ncbi:recombinase [Hafnia paralvei]|uniref:Rad52/Rad22 family DNA repair protein n=1 Tax=Hafnia paralvei TaxID=546367 RepID=UPI000DF159BF|nr:Rad52/Rad22 family DNA repair protein [Hafnia paralvei]RDA68310.1 recombinase [Hafnia paralvei]RDA69349.1 recombinase [Hafnia paralvei]RDA69510.1 recombinase [Hafnia paralvei]RDA79553.1 recombinase [Hafnia paralvei]RDA80090.1 recombinase [Hafnia paralvei]